MRFVVQNKTGEKAINITRQAGYVFLDKKDGQFNCVRQIGGSNYPRFHIYFSEKDNSQIEVNLHLDQKAPSYGRQTAHSGEYKSDNPLLLAEAQRIQQLLQGLPLQ